MIEPQKEPLHHYTIRIPRSVYVPLYNLAKSAGVPMNTKVVELLRRGLSNDNDLRRRIEEMLDREFPDGQPTKPEHPFLETH